MSAERKPRTPSKCKKAFARRFILFGALVLLAAPHAEATPRMISYGYPNCMACHVSVQGRGLLNTYGRGIDMAQSYSKKDYTALLLGRSGNRDDPDGNWDGRFGNLLMDVLSLARVNHRFDSSKTELTSYTLLRQTVFFDKRDLIRLNTEIGLRDSGLDDTRLGPNLTAVGGDKFFLKKLLLEWRVKDDGAGSGHELALGRDYLPLGLQIDDITTFLLHLNRSGIYDFPLQLKYFVWNEKSLASAFVYAPSFDEPSNNREYGGGFLYERYPVNTLALGFQGLAALGDESDRLRIGAYTRWGISNKWTLLAEVDYDSFWDGRVSAGQGSQVTTFLQLFYHHYEWLVSSVTANYAYSDFLTSKTHLGSFRYTVSARLSRNFTVGTTYAIGDILRDLGYTKELAVYATVKF